MYSNRIVFACHQPQNSCCSSHFSNTISSWTTTIKYPDGLQNHREPHLHQLKSNSGNILWKAQVVYMHLDVICVINHDVCMTIAWNQDICVQVIHPRHSEHDNLHISFRILAAQPPQLTANHRWGIKCKQMWVYNIFMSTHWAIWTCITCWLAADWSQTMQLHIL